MKSRMFRIFWLLTGLLFTGLAFIGVVLPLVPTTPFLLLAAFCFARSSEHLRNWLYTHRWFGPLLNNWEQYGAIGRRTKLLAALMLLATPMLSFYLGAKLWVVGLQIPILMGSAGFILSRPSLPTQDIDPSDQS